MGIPVPPVSLRPWAYTACGAPVEDGTRIEVGFRELLNLEGNRANRDHDAEEKHLHESEEEHLDIYVGYIEAAPTDRGAGRRGEGEGRPATREDNRKRLARHQISGITSRFT